MRLEFHPAVQRDFNAALDYYEAQGGPHLADRFEEEFRNCLAAIKAGPTHFSFYQESDRFRRIHFENFPYILVSAVTDRRYRFGFGTRATTLPA